MAQPNDTGSPAAVLPLSAFSLDASPDRAPDDLAIFSAPGVEAVFQWWLESKRRWSARDGAKLVMPALSVGSDDLSSGESR